MYSKVSTLTGWHLINYSAWPGRPGGWRGGGEGGGAQGIFNLFVG